MLSDVKFVQLGLRRKGRIVKNESYTLAEFFNKVKRVGYNTAAALKIPGFFARFSDKKLRRALEKTHDQGYGIGYEAAFKHIEDNIIDLIHADKFGKKRKK